MDARGFALAARPVTAATITTDTQGLDAGPTTIRAADIDLPGYYAMPASGGKLPVVLVVQEIFGMHEHIRDVCRRLAKAGYLAITAELYVRQGDVSQLADTARIRQVVAKVPDAQVLSDLDAMVTWAEQSGKADVARLGITGFCWGGRIVWLYAAHSTKLKAGVAWYGRVTGENDPLHPMHPIDVAAEMKAPVLGLYGALDEGIPVATVEQMRTALRHARKSAEFVIYPDAGHAFYADYRPNYVPGAAQDGWNRMLAWFESYGV